MHFGTAQNVNGSFLYGHLPMICMDVTFWTHSSSNQPAAHLEQDVRIRAGVTPPDPAWTPDQLPTTWAPNMVTPSMKRRLDQTVHGLLRRSPRDARPAAAPPARTRNPRGKGAKPKEVRL